MKMIYYGMMCFLMSTRIWSWILIALVGLSGFSTAVTLQELVEHLAETPDEGNHTIVTKKDNQTTIKKLTIKELNHDEIIDSFREEKFITREQFAYMLDLLTNDVEAIRYIDRCGFRDYEEAQSILWLAAVNTLCHKWIVRGTYQRRYYYGAKLTEAEAVTMVVRAKFLDEYDHLRDLESEAPAGQWYVPYYERAVRAAILTDSIKSYGSLRPLSPFVALELLEHVFWSVSDGAKNNPLSTIIYQTAHNNNHAHIVWRIRDIKGRDIHIDDDSISVSLDPYQDTLQDDVVFTSKSCDTKGECLTKIEFDVDRESNRTRYCGQMTYIIDDPYTKKVTENFCLDK